MKNTATNRALIAELVVDGMSYRELKKGLMYELCNRYQAEVGLFDTVIDILRDNDMLPVPEVSDGKH